MEGSQVMTAGNQSSDALGEQGAAATATVGAIREPARLDPASKGKTGQRIGLRPTGLLFSPQGTLVWIIGLLGLGACSAPWFTRRWLWFGPVARTRVHLACYDAISLSVTR